ncbi:uroporphyrinogen decarboxylase [Psittacicella gerlachiana]|uniref:Uroporphyrinogen decarboxylase n=1 Tax=Psittacicella gerlachiana TaxID=2028574 RepID=A0A3A1YBX2_9GAMM|nr:uroporphyrinogen decarboxylase [Psittacicella gerlachiana]RIY34876.1 uroporphyrinogen decarboxylase [Psittacicella gerlachiana]
MEKELKNDLYIRALLREETERTPAWMMRQAGRYLPEYRELRAKAGDFMSLCKNPELACEVTLQPLRRYPLDAAILFSDILTIPDALGLGLYFSAGEGPHFERPINSLSDINNLGILDPNDSLKYVTDAVETITRELKGEVPLIGFSGSPWTLATYMVEGKSSKQFTKIKQMMYREPDHLHKLLRNLALNVANYLNAQIEAGVRSVMIFDTWGGVLGHREYRTFSLEYMSLVISLLTREVNGQRIPVTVFTKGGGLWLSHIAESGADAVGVDWTVNLGTARKQVGNRVAIQGNVDPSILYGTPESIEQSVYLAVNDYGDGYSAQDLEFNRGHVFNLGHGIHQDVPVESPAIMLEALRKFTERK